MALGRMGDGRKRGNAGDQGIDRGRVRGASGATGVKRHGGPVSGSRARSAGVIPAERQLPPMARARAAIGHPAKMKPRNRGCAGFRGRRAVSGHVRQHAERKNDCEGCPRPENKPWAVKHHVTQGFH